MHEIAYFDIKETGADSRAIVMTADGWRAYKEGEMSDYAQMWGDVISSDREVQLLPIFAVDEGPLLTHHSEGDSSTRARYVVTTRGVSRSLNMSGGRVGETLYRTSDGGPAVAAFLASRFGVEPSERSGWTRGDIERSMSIYALHEAFIHGIHEWRHPAGATVREGTLDHRSFEAAVAASGAIVAAFELNQSARPRSILESIFQAAQAELAGEMERRAPQNRMNVIP